MNLILLGCSKRAEFDLGSPIPFSWSIDLIYKSAWQPECRVIHWSRWLITQFFRTLAEARFSTKPLCHRLVYFVSCQLLVWNRGFTIELEQTITRICQPEEEQPYIFLYSNNLIKPIGPHESSRWDFVIKHYLISQIHLERVSLSEPESTIWNHTEIFLTA